jgi:hypothetical protein
MPDTSVALSVSPSGSLSLESTPAGLVPAPLAVNVASSLTEWVSPVATGASLTLFTVMVKNFSKLALPESVVLTRTEYELLLSKLKLAAVLSVPLLSMVNEALSALPVPATSE